jgi:hypothetical protein
MATKYPDFDPMVFADVPFLPAFKNGQPTVGTPKEVFANQQWAEFGLLVVPPTMPQDAIVKLKIKQHPPTGLLVGLLEKNPPKDGAQATKWFGILATQLNSMFIPF